MAQEISFDDLIPATKERAAATPAVSSTAPVTSSNEISFDDLLPVESEQPKIPTTSLGSFGAAAGEGAVTARGAIAGARYAMAVTPPILPFVGPLAKPIAGIVGGVGSAILTNYGIKNIYQLADSVFGTNIEATREAQQRQNPIATKSGFIAGGSLNPWMRPMLPKTVAGAAGMGAVGLGVGAGVRALQGEKVFDPKEMTIDAVTGAFVGPTARGRAALGLPPESKAPPSREGELPTKPPEGSTPEQKQAYIDKLKTIVSEREAKIPLVETAIKNKETGEIELMGPKHNEQRKLETIDTHDQGFITEDNRFLDRKQAFEQAKRSGQIPEGQNPTDISIGLRSEDLRIAGDKRFAITEEQPAGVPKSSVDLTQKPFDPNELVSRQDFKTAIDDKEFRRGVSLEIDMVEAERSGDIRRIAELKAEDARLTSEIEQLRKNIPDVKFADVNKPTWEELQDYLWGARNVGQAFDRLVSNNIGTPQEQLLAKLLSRSQFIRNANLEFEPNYLLYVDPQGNVKNDAIGLYTGEDIHTVKLGKDGDIQTLLHEAIHAATLRLLIEGNSVAAKKLIQLHKEFLSKHDVEYQIKLKAFKDASPNRILTVKELNDFRKENKAEYGLTNVREFVAEAFTNKEFQNLLASIESKEPGSGVTSNLWEAFKNYVREGLNIPPGKRTAFDDVMDSGITLVEESKQFSRFDAPSESYLKGTLSAPSRLSQEIHDQLGREGIAIAHTSPYKFGMFNWVKNALSGEGANAFGAGTYGSQKDSTNKYYIQGFKQKAIDKYLELPEGKVDKIKLDAIEQRITVTFQKLNNLDSKIQKIIQEKEYLKTQAIGPEGDLYKEQIKRQIQELEIKETQLNEDYSLTLKNYQNIESESTFFREQLAEKIKVPTYHSTIKASSEELLDWNSKTQSSLVYKAFEKLGIDEYELSKKNSYYDDEGDGWQPGSVTGEDLYRALSKKFEPTDKATRNLITDREAQQIGDAKASIALAEQGVVGNVHNAQGGTEQKFRNYVVFDDSRITQNLVSLASIKKKTTLGSPDEPPVIDRTKTNPRDVQNEKEFYEIATDIYQKHGEVEAVKFFEGYQKYKKTFLEPISETEKFVGINLRNKAANERIFHNESADMKDLVPDLSRREAIAIAVDRGDLSGLSPTELLVAKNYSELVKNIGDEAVNKGVVKGLIEDYVTHIVNWADAPKGFKEEFLTMLLGTSKNDPTMRGMTTESKFAKERTFKTFENLEVYLEQANKRLEASGSTFRLQLKTKDIAEIYKEYALSMQKAIENKSLVDNLKQIRNVNGVSLIQEITKENPLPQSWVMMDSPQFAGYAVHPDLLPALKFVFDAGPGQLMGALGAISQVTKRLNVVGSFFHAKSLMEVLSSTGIPIWTPLKEAVVLPLAEKAVKGLTGKELELSAITKAVNQYRKGGAGDNVDKWIKEGRLQLESPEDVSKGVLTAAGKFADEMIGKYGPKTRVLEKSLSTVEKYTLGIFDKYTWDYLHTGGKLMVADAFLDKARLNAAKEGRVFDEVASRREISSFVDSSFGGLNWFEIATQTRTKLGKDIAMATYSPAGRRALQIGLFAPDWTISTIRAFTMALPKGFNPTKWHPVEGIKGMRTPTTKQDYARLYQFKTALTYLTLLNGINMIVANRPIWENKDKSRIEFPDGTSMQAMKHAMEPYHWITDPDKTLSNKLGFIPKAAIIGVAGTEYASPQAPKIVPPNVTGISSVDSALGRAKAIGSMALPFQVQAAATAPPGEGVKRAVLGTMGLPVYGGTAEQKKTARAEREKILKENAARYRQKEKEAGR